MRSNLKEVQMATQTRVCNDCGAEKDLTSANFRKSKSKPKVVWEPMCKICKSRQVRDHYRGWDRLDIEQRGEFGVKCVLWAEPVCGRCPCTADDLTKCWRLTEDESDPDNEGYPDILLQ